MVELVRRSDQPDAQQRSSVDQTLRRRLHPARWGPSVLVPLGLLALSGYMYRDVLVHPGQRLPGGPDGIEMAWYFEYVEQALVHLHNPLISSGLNAPDGFSLMWNTSVLALAVICAPLTATLGAFATVGLVFAVSPALSAITAYFVLRRLTGSWIGAALGALLYAFGPFAFGQAGHLHLVFAPFPPLLLLLLHRLLVEDGDSSRRIGVLLGALVGVQLLISEEIVALCAAGAAIALIWLAALYRDRVAQRWRSVLTALAWALGVSLLIAGVPLAVQMFGPHALPRGVIPGSARADVASFVRPSLLEHFSTRSSVAANYGFPANPAENTAYLGWPLIVGVGLVAIQGLLRRDRFLTWWLLTTLGIVALSLGTPVSAGGHDITHGPWALFWRVPLLGGAQPVRLSLLTALMIAWLMARFVARQHVSWRALAPLGVSVLVLVPLWPAHTVRAARLPSSPRFFTSASVDDLPPGAATVVLPQAAFPRVSAMVHQIRSHLRFDLVGGYSIFEVDGRSTSDPPLPPFETALRDAERTGKAPEAARSTALRASLAASRVRFIVITQQEPHAAAVTRTAMMLTGCNPRAVADVVLCSVEAR